MFREILKKKNEISINEAKDILKKARRGVLALSGENDFPYAIPINYYYDGCKNKIYFHGSLKGHKVDALKRNDKVCLTIIGEEIIKEETWAPYLRSVIVFGRCHILPYDDSAKEILKRFANKYYPDKKMVMDEIASADIVGIYEIDIEYISAKQVQEK